MGTMNYADASHGSIPFDDRMLAHLKHVIVSKLRRGESFIFSWDTDQGGRSSIWISQSIPIEFDFDDKAPQPLNRAWIERLSETAATMGGLLALPEPDNADGR